MGPWQSQWHKIPLTLVLVLASYKCTVFEEPFIDQVDHWQYQLHEISPPLPFVVVAILEVHFSFDQVDPVTDLLSVWRLSDDQLLLQMIGLHFTKPAVWVILKMKHHIQHCIRQHHICHPRSWFDKNINIRWPRRECWPLWLFSKGMGRMRKSMDLGSTGQARWTYFWLWPIIY